jgi:putative DNA methylase
LAAARAVIWASLVDDPSSLPEQFPTEEEQNTERKRLFKILTELVLSKKKGKEAYIQPAGTTKQLKANVII